jgi:hypothetical protein
MVLTYTYLRAGIVGMDVMLKLALKMNCEVDYRVSTLAPAIAWAIVACITAMWMAIRWVGRRL